MPIVDIGTCRYGHLQLDAAYVACTLSKSEPLLQLLPLARCPHGCTSINCHSQASALVLLPRLTAQQLADSWGTSLPQQQLVSAACSAGVLRPASRGWVIRALWVAGRCTSAAGSPEIHRHPGQHAAAVQLS